MESIINSIAREPGLLIPIISIVVGGLVGGAVAITAMIIKHRERLARIEHGLEPDSPRRL